MKKELDYCDVYDLSEDMIENIDNFYRDYENILVEYDPNYEDAFASDFGKYKKLNSEDFVSLNNMYSENWLDDIDYSKIELDCDRNENTIEYLSIDIDKVIKTFRYFNWREPYSEDELFTYIENGQYDIDYSYYKDVKMNNICKSREDNRKIEYQVMSRSTFDMKVEDTWGESIYRIGEYNCATKYMVFKCNQCGGMFAQIGRYVYLGKGCPNCHKKIYRGENVVAKYLDFLNVDYLRQYNDGCINPKTNRPLPYDFVINNLGNTIYVEVQGRQHYSSVEYFGGVLEFESTKNRDKIKKDYAQSNGTYVELDYREHDINLLKLRIEKQLLPLLKEVK